MFKIDIVGDQIIWVAANKALVYMDVDEHDNLTIIVYDAIVYDANHDDQEPTHRIIVPSKPGSKNKEQN